MPKILTLFLALIFFGSNSALAAKSPWEAQWSAVPFKTAIIHYAVEGSDKGEETLYIRAQGMEQVQARKTVGKSLFRTVTTDTIKITTREFIIEMDMAAKTGEKSANPVKFMIEEYNQLTPAEQETVRKNSLSMGTNMMSGMMGGGLMKFEKDAGEILGYKCDLVSGLGMRIWSVAGTGIALKTEMSLISSTTTTATKVEAGASIPASAFEPPAGVNITYNKEKDRQNQEMAKSMMDMLKDPETAKNMEKAQQEAAKEGGEDSKGKVKGPVITDEQRQEANEAVKKGVETLKGIFGGK